MSIAFGFLLVNNTDLFLIAPKKTMIENKELVQNFIDTPSYFTGKIIRVENSILTAEKSIQNSLEQRTALDFEITADTRIYVQNVKLNYFFDSISSEYQRYEGIEIAEFISQNYEKMNKNILIWGSNGKAIDQLVVVQWTE